MDTLGKRYSGCPFFILDEFIRLGQLHDFLSEVLKTINREEVDRYKWEYYLHKVFDMTYEEYLKKTETKESEDINYDQIKDIVCDSRNMMDGLTI